MVDDKELYEYESWYQYIRDCIEVRIHNLKCDLRLFRMNFIHLNKMRFVYLRRAFRMLRKGYNLADITEDRHSMIRQVRFQCGLDCTTLRLPRVEEDPAYYFTDDSVGFWSDTVKK